MNCDVCDVCSGHPSSNSCSQPLLRDVFSEYVYHSPNDTKVLLCTIVAMTKTNVTFAIVFCLYRLDASVLSSEDELIIQALVLYLMGQLYI